MALRVLLADESSTIKKVIQLSLHDFGVEVKSVSNGLDVIQVLENFKPDIVFVDVLLSKKTGYEVCAEIKNHSLHGHLPVVMMWSGFMSLDESKTIIAKPDARLEKPFDSEQIRSLVSSLVPKTNSNPIKDFLAFPKMPDFSEDAEKIKQVLGQKNQIYQQNTPVIQATHQPQSQNRVVDRQMPSQNQTYNAKMPPPPPPNEAELMAKMDEEWAQQPLKRSDSSQKKSEYNDFGIKDLSQAKIRVTDEFEEISFDDPPEAPAPMMMATLDPQTNPYNPAPQQMNRSLADQQNSLAALLHPDQIEKIIREEVQKMATEMCLKICQKILPEVAEKLVQQEIQRILLENPQK